MVIIPLRKTRRDTDTEGHGHGERRSARRRTHGETGERRRPGAPGFRRIASCSTVETGATSARYLRYPPRLRFLPDHLPPFKTFGTISLAACCQGCCGAGASMSMPIEPSNYRARKIFREMRIRAFERGDSSNVSVACGVKNPHHVAGKRWPRRYRRRDTRRNGATETNGEAIDSRITR